MTVTLITGCRGFIGRHLAREASSVGTRVCGIGHGAWPEAERNIWGIDYWLNGSVTKQNLAIVKSIVGRPDLVFHLAGGSSVGGSLVAPEEDFSRTVVSTAELLEWARMESPTSKLVLASSAAVYGAGHTSAISEDAPIAPYSPYGFHKRIAEELFQSYGQNFGLSTAIVRLFSVYGTELRKQLLWDACSRLLSDKSRLALSGSGGEVRDWIHVMDAVQVLREAAKHATPDCLIVNGGTGIPTQIREVAEILLANWATRTPLEFSGACRQGDPQYLVADIGRLSALGFQPTNNLDSGIASYVNWFLRDAAGKLS